MKKLIIILVLMIILVGGGAFAAAKFFGVGPLVEVLEKLEKKDEKAEAKVEAPPPEPQDFYYELGSFIVPMVNKGTVGRQVGVDLALRVVPKSGPRISADIPRLQNAILTELYDFMPRHSDPHSPEDKKAIHDKLLKLAVRMYGEGTVRDIIIKSIYEK